MENYDVKKLLDLSGKIALVSGGAQNLGKDMAAGYITGQNIFIDGGFTNFK